MMMKHLFWPFIVAVSVSSALAQSDAPPPGDAGQGKTLFINDGCYECHGTVGQGSRTTGPRLAPDPVPFDAFAHQVRTPADVMPPYTQLVLSDAQLADIYAYLSSLPEPPKASDVTILR